MNKEEKETVEELRKQLRLAINIDDVATTIRNDDAETMLNLIEKLQKENEELKDFKKQVTDIESTNFIKYKNYIQIQKVKDKIEELNNNRQYLSQFNDYKEKNYTNEEVINNCVEVLQELLESE